MSFFIGNVKIPGRLALGPMAGITDLPFRLLCKEQGAALLYTEMVSAKGVMYGNKNTAELLKTCDAERPVALQLFGEDPEILAEQARALSALPFDLFDVNMGCPVPKVVGNGEGSALMKRPERIGEIVAAMVAAQPKPVTVKIRKGFQETNAVEVAKIAEQAGASAIAVHGRTREQYYSGKADWEIIRKVKYAVSVPVIGSGDVTSPEECLRMLEETGCDCVMIARAARGNPFLFARCKHFLETGELLPEPTVQETADMCLRHARMVTEQKGEEMGMREMRKHVAWYFGGYPGSAKLRQHANFLTNYEELKELLKKYQGKKL